ncbi:MAG TPA: nitroreductase family protein [Rhizomicrobium sp.]|nr:nitroreductase family protein [Rhizomicrobium sp.]
MKITDALRDRRSVREYKREAVPRRTVETLIEAATLAPSAMNEQPWHFTVVQDKALLDTLSDRAKAHMLSSGGPVLEPHRSMLQERAFHIFYHAPALIVISAPEKMPWAVEDCALAAENLMLAAADEGLGTCWIGFAQSLLATDVGTSFIGLPPGLRCVAPIVVGRPAQVPLPVARRNPAIHWIG